MIFYAHPRDYQSISKNVAKLGKGANESLMLFKPWGFDRRQRNPYTTSCHIRFKKFTKLKWNHESQASGFSAKF